MPRKREPEPRNRDLESHLKKLAKRVALLREEDGLSQQELASRAGLSSTTIYEIENGRIADIRLSTLTVIARVLEVSIWDLIDSR